MDTEVHEDTVNTHKRHKVRHEVRAIDHTTEKLGVKWSGRDKGAQEAGAGRAGEPLRNPTGT